MIEIWAPGLELPTLGKEPAVELIIGQVLNSEVIGDQASVDVLYWIKMPNGIRQPRLQKAQLRRDSSGTWQIHGVKYEHYPQLIDPERSAFHPLTVALGYVTAYYNQDLNVAKELSTTSWEPSVSKTKPLVAVPLGVKDVTYGAYETTVFLDFRSDYGKGEEVWRTVVKVRRQSDDRWLVFEVQWEKLSPQ